MCVTWYSWGKNIVSKIIDVHNINLDEVYKKIAKNATSKKKVNNSSEIVAASFFHDNQSLHSDRNSSIQWTAGANFVAKSDHKDEFWLNMSLIWKRLHQ